jgi:hypothetical protein
LFSQKIIQQTLPNTALPNLWCLFQCEQLKLYFFITFNHFTPDDPIRVITRINDNWFIEIIEQITYYPDGATLIKLNPINGHQEIHIANSLSTEFACVASVTVFNDQILPKLDTFDLDPLPHSHQIFQHIGIPNYYLARIDTKNIPNILDYDLFIMGLDAYFKVQRKTVTPCEKITLFVYALIYLSGTYTYPSICTIVRSRKDSGCLFIETTDLEAKKLAAMLNARLGRGFCTYLPEYNTEISPRRRTRILVSIEGVRMHWDRIVNAMDCIPKAMICYNKGNDYLQKRHFSTIAYPSPLPPTSSRTTAESTIAESEIAGKASRLRR